MDEMAPIHGIDAGMPPAAAFDTPMSQDRQATQGAHSNGYGRNGSLASFGPTKYPPQFYAAPDPNRVTPSKTETPRNLTTAQQHAHNRAIQEKGPDGQPLSAAYRDPIPPNNNPKSELPWTAERLIDVKDAFGVLYEANPETVARINQSLNDFLDNHNLRHKSLRNQGFPEGLRWECICSRKYGTGAGCWYHLHKSTRSCDSIHYNCLVCDLTDITTRQEAEKHVIEEHGWTPQPVEPAPPKPKKKKKTKQERLDSEKMKLEIQQQNALRSVFKLEPEHEPIGVKIEPPRLDPLMTSPPPIPKRSAISKPNGQSKPKRIKSSKPEISKHVADAQFNRVAIPPDNQFYQQYYQVLEENPDDGSGKTPYRIICTDDPDVNHVNHETNFIELKRPDFIPSPNQAQQLDPCKLPHFTELLPLNQLEVKEVYPTVLESQNAQTTYHLETPNHAILPQIHQHTDPNMLSGQAHQHLLPPCEGQFITTPIPDITHLQSISNFVGSDSSPSNQSTQMYGYGEVRAEDATAGEPAPGMPYGACVNGMELEYQESHPKRSYVTTKPHSTNHSKMYIDGSNCSSPKLKSALCYPPNAGSPQLACPVPIHTTYPSYAQSPHQGHSAQSPGAYTNQTYFINNSNQATSQSFIPMAKTNRGIADPVPLTGKSVPKSLHAMTNKNAALLNALENTEYDAPPAPLSPSLINTHREIWSSVQVLEWLKCIGLESFRNMFLVEEIQGWHLDHLSADNLDGLGMKRLGHQITFKHELRRLQALQDKKMY